MKTRQEEHAAHQHRVHDRADDRGRREHLVAEDAQVDHRDAVAVSSRMTNATIEMPATKDRRRDERRVEPVVLLPLFEDVLQRRDAHAHEDDPHDVEVLALRLGARAIGLQHVFRLVDEAQRHDQCRRRRSGRLM